MPDWDVRIDKTLEGNTIVDKVNDALELLQSNWETESDPAVKGESVAGMIWVDAANGKLKGRDLGDTLWYELGDWAPTLGMLKRDGSNTMNGNLQLADNDVILDSLGNVALRSGAVDTFRVINSGGTILEVDGTNLDFKDNQIKDPDYDAIAPPNTSWDHRIRVNLGGTLVYVPARTV